MAVVEPITPVAAKVTKAGQISLPAAVRHRWNAARVVIVDHGDHLEVRPLPDDILGRLQGKYAGLGGMTSDELRAEFRREEAEAEERKWSL